MHRYLSPTCRYWERTCTASLIVFIRYVLHQQLKKLRNCCFNLVRMARSNLSLLPGRYTLETESHVPTKKKKYFNSSMFVCHLKLCSTSKLCFNGRSFKVVYVWYYQSSFYKQIVQQVLLYIVLFQIGLILLQNSLDVISLLLRLSYCFCSCQVHFMLRYNLKK